MLTLLEKTRKINKVLQLSGHQAISFIDLGKILSEVLDANVYIASRRGKLLGYAFATNYECEISDEMISDGDEEAKFPKEYNDTLLNVRETNANMTEESPLCV